jgi:hypothetical protein
MLCSAAMPRTTKSSFSKACGSKTGGRFRCIIIGYSRIPGTPFTSIFQETATDIENIVALRFRMVRSIRMTGVFQDIVEPERLVFTSSPLG